MNVFNRAMIGVFIGISVFVFLTWILVAQYRFFKEQALELIQLQDHYRNGLIVLRKSIEEISSDQYEKKKSI